MTQWKAVGRVALLLKAMQAEPDRTFTSREAAAIMQCRNEAVAASIKYALANKAMHCLSFGRGVPMLLRGTPFPPDFNEVVKRERRPRQCQTWKEGGAQASRGWTTDPDDPRIGKVDPTWKPPVMRCTRSGA